MEEQLSNNQSLQPPPKLALMLRKLLPALPRRLRGHVVKHFDEIVRPHSCVDDVLGVPFEYGFGWAEGSLFHGLYEAEDAYLIRQLLAPGMTVIDVGANIGWYSALFAGGIKPSGIVLAIEPHPDNIRRLSRLKELLPDTAMMEIIPCILSHQVGKATLYLNKFHPGHSISEGFVKDNQTAFPGETMTVDSLTLDSLISQYQLKRIDLLKIDVEGAEMAVLQGGESMLATGRVLRIFVEVSNYDNGSTLFPTLDLDEYLRRFNYSGYVIKKGTLRPATEEELKVRQRNILYLHKSIDV